MLEQGYLELLRDPRYIYISIHPYYSTIYERSSIIIEQTLLDLQSTPFCLIKTMMRLWSFTFLNVISLFVKAVEGAENSDWSFLMLAGAIILRFSILCNYFLIDIKPHTLEHLEGLNTDQRQV